MINEASSRDLHFIICVYTHTFIRIGANHFTSSKLFLSSRDLPAAPLVKWGYSC